MTALPDILDTADFQTIRGEIDKLEKFQADPVDWPVVADRAGALQETYPLDLRLACWRARAELDSRGMDGLTAGLERVGHLLSECWETFTPQSRRPRTRLAPLGWLHDKLLLCLRGEGRGTAEERAASRAALAAVAATVAERAPDYAFDFSPLLSLLAEPPPPSPAGRAAVAAKDGEPPDVSLGDVSTPRAFRKALGDLAERLLAGDRGDPLAYRLARAAIWREVCQPPAADANGVTLLQGVPLDRVRGYAQMASAGRHEELLPQLETSACRCVFWLDGQRLIAESLLALGHDRAAAAVAGETRELVERLAGLGALKFSDGRPFADAETQKWLARPARRGASPVPSPAAPQVPGDGSPAIELYRQGRAKEALESLERPLAGQGRARFLAALDLARFHLEIGCTGIALLHLEQLNDEFDARQLDDWEPSLGGELASLLIEAAPASPVGKQAARLARVRARLDHIGDL